MLDEVEFAEVYRLFTEAMMRAKKEGARSWMLHDRLAPVRREYERVTGLADCPANAIMHHQLASFGPDCRACGRPLRTSQARHCAECGAWTDQLRVDLSRPRHGWLRLTVGMGEQWCELRVSSVAYDSLTDLAGALCGLLESGRCGVVTVLSEPEVYELVFDRQVGLSIGLRGREPSFVFGKSSTELALGFWRALRHIERGFDARHWSREFPTKVVAQLGQLVGHE